MSEYSSSTVHNCKEKPENVKISYSTLTVKGVEVKVDYCPFCGKKL